MDQITIIFTGVALGTYYVLSPVKIIEKTMAMIEKLVTGRKRVRVKARIRSYYVNNIK